MSDENTNTAEIWKPIPGWEDLYEVSNIGRLRRIGKGKGAKVGAIIKPAALNHGHLHAHLYRNGRGTGMMIHRAVLAAFVGPCPPEHEIDHINGIPNDNRVENLEYVTHAENMRRAGQMGRMSNPGPKWAIRGDNHYMRRCPEKARHGEQNFNAKLTEDTVREVRQRLSNGEQCKSIAKSYGVSDTTISRIKNGQMWKHII